MEQQRESSKLSVRKRKRRQGTADWSREIFVEQQAALSRIVADIERNLREDESITSIAQIRFQYIMQCLPEAQRYLFEKDDPQRTAEENLLGNMLNMVTYASASALRIHRPKERPNGGRCPVKRCRQPLSLLVHPHLYIYSTHRK
jgi:hypothetical protein